jgi:hypothetical protein
MYGDAGRAVLHGPLRLRRDARLGVAPCCGLLTQENARGIASHFRADASS